MFQFEEPAMVVIALLVAVALCLPVAFAATDSNHMREIEELIRRTMPRNLHMSDSELRIFVEHCVGTVSERAYERAIARLENLGVVKRASDGFWERVPETV